MFNPAISPWAQALNQVAITSISPVISFFPSATSPAA
jgi:hypothetical protein